MKHDVIMERCQISLLDYPKAIQNPVGHARPIFNFFLSFQKKNAVLVVYFSLQNLHILRMFFICNGKLILEITINKNQIIDKTVLQNFVEFEQKYTTEKVIFLFEMTKKIENRPGVAEICQKVTESFWDITKETFDSFPNESALFKSLLIAFKVLFVFQCFFSKTVEIS